MKSSLVLFMTIAVLLLTIQPTEAQQSKRSKSKKVTPQICYDCDPCLDCDPGPPPPPPPDEPVPRDYDGDGRADLSIKTSDGRWLIDYASNGFGAFDQTIILP